MQKDGTTFGWKTIIEMWQRECERSEKGEMRRIPKLLPSYIERDAWTKLNVAPAKIMQVCSCIICLETMVFLTGKNH